MSGKAVAGLRVVAMFRTWTRVTSIWAVAVVIASSGVIETASAGASAHELTAAERAGLARRVDEFVTAMREGRSEAVVDVVSPRMLAYIAELRHISIETLHGSMVGQMDKIEASGAITAFDIDLTSARYETLADGMPYVLIPTDTVLKAADHKIRKHTDTLGFMDEGRWYFARINTPALVARLVAVYPHFAGVDIGGETTTVVP